MCVEWFPSGTNQPVCDADMLRELALLGFRDPSIGLEPNIPVEILEGPSLEAGLEKMLEEEGAFDGLPCGASDVSLADADDDWSELV